MPSPSAVTVRRNSSRELAAADLDHQPGNQAGAHDDHQRPGRTPPAAGPTQGRPVPPQLAELRQKNQGEPGPDPAPAACRSSPGWKGCPADPGSAGSSGRPSYWKGTHRLRTRATRSRPSPRSCPRPNPPPMMMTSWMGVPIRAISPHRAQFLEGKLDAQGEQQQGHADLGQQFDVVGVGDAGVRRVTGPRRTPRRYNPESGAGEAAGRRLPPTRPAKRMIAMSAVMPTIYLRRWPRMPRRVWRVKSRSLSRMSVGQ